MSNYGAVAISGGMQGPTFSKLGSQISAAKNADVTSGSTLSGGQGMLILFADMRDSLLSIQQNTLETVELLRTAITGDATAQRDENLSSGDTDVSDDDSTKKPGILSRVGKSIKGMASSVFGSTLGKLALAAGGFTLLKLFGDDAIGPLADLIKTIKQGKIGENISKAYEYIKEVGTEAFEGLKTNTILFIDGVKKMVELVKTIYTSINDYVMSFDTIVGSKVVDNINAPIPTGDGRLDTKELKDLRNDLISRAATYVADLVGDVFSAILALIPLSQIVPLSVGLGFTALKRSLGIGAAATLGSSMVTGGAAASAAGAATRGSTTAAKFGLASALKVGGIGLIVANSIFQVYQGIGRALENSLNEDGTRDYSKFVAYFFGGNKEGGTLNAIIQANSVGGMFAGPAALVGLATFGFPGALIGGALGYGIGAIVGGIAGYMGAENLNDLISIVGSSLKDGLLGIANFFNNFVEGIANLASGGSFSDAFSQTELDRKKKALAKLQKKTGINPFKTTEADAIAALGEVPVFDASSLVPGGGPERVEYDRKLRNIKNLFKMKDELKDYIKDESASLPTEIEAAQAALEAHLAAGPEKVSQAYIEKNFPKRTFRSDAEKQGFIDDLQIKLNGIYAGKTKMLEDNLKATINKQNEIDLEKKNITLPGNLQETSRAQLDKINRTNGISGSMILNDLTNMMSLNDKLNKDIRPFIVDNNNDKSVKVQNETHVGGNLSQDRVNNSGKILASRAIGVPGTF